MMPLTPEKQAHKRSFVQLVQAAGGFEAAALFCRLGKSQLHNACSPNEPGTFLPSDAKLDLERVTVNSPGHPIVTRFEARQLGFELVKLPEPSAAAGDLLALLAGLAKEGGEVMSTIALHAPGGITAAEVRASNLIDEINELIAVAVNMRAAALAVVGD